MTKVEFSVKIVYFCGPPAMFHNIAYMARDSKYVL